MTSSEAYVLCTLKHAECETVKVQFKNAQSD